MLCLAHSKRTESFGLSLTRSKGAYRMVIVSRTDFHRHLWCCCSPFCLRYSVIRQFGCPVHICPPQEWTGMGTPEPRYVVTMTYVIGPLFMLIVKQWKVHTYIHIDVKCSVIPELIGFDEVGGGT